MNREKILSKNRKFKLWFYHVTHGEILLRSPKNEHFDTNIDIYMSGVEYLDIPNDLGNISFEDSTQKDIDYLYERTHRHFSDKSVYVIITNDIRYYIVAHNLYFYENDLEFLEIPFYTFIKNSNE